MSDAEARERLVRGGKGDKGEPGEGMTRGARYAIVALFVLTLALTGFNMLYTAHYVHATQAAEQSQGAAVERKLCTTLGRLTALKPPSGNPLANPARAYDQELHSVLAQLGPDVGCNRRTP